MTIFNGTAGNDTITPAGLSGIATTAQKNTPDIVYGNGGNDVINFSSSLADNDLFGSTGNDTITGGIGNDVIYSGGGNNNLTGGAGNDQIVIDQAGNNIVNGGTGNDLIYVLASGADSLTGGIGNDLFYVGGGSTTAITDLGTGADILKVAAGATVTATVTTPGWTANSQSKNNGVATLKTAGFAVDVSAADGINGWTITNTSATGATLTGSANNDTITGGAGADSISAGAGNDTIGGFAGSDTVDGGAGVNTLNISGANALAIAADAQLANIQIVNALAASTIDLHNQVENFTINGGIGADVITGGQGNDAITGGAGIDTFNVASGTDSISDLGLGGAEKLIVGSGATANATIAAAWTATNVSANNGTANLSSNGYAVNVALATGLNGFNITNTGAATTLAGSAQADSILGGAGNDTIVGFAGQDTVDGGAGDNTLKVAGINADLASATDAQLSNIQFIVATAASSIDLHNQTEAFTITGSTSADSITGSLNGGDVINANSGADVITVATGGGDTITGGSSIDTFVINSGTNSITDLGAGGADILNVGAGATVNATVTTAWTASVATTNNGTANLTTNGLSVKLAAVTGGSNGFSVTNIGAGATLSGSALNDTLAGGAGNDILMTTSGTDSLTGGDGDDSFKVNGGTGNISDFGNGADVLVVSIGATANATLTGAWTASSASSNKGAAYINTSDLAVDLHLVTGGVNGFNITDTGSAGNTLSGSAKADNILAGGGNDTISRFVGADTVDGGAGVNTLEISGTNALATATDAQLANIQVVNALIASTINLSTQSEGFSINGSGFNDALTGGAGSDTITGGLGIDTFAVNSGIDTITDLGNGADILKVNGGAASVTLAGAWTATSASLNNGTADVYTNDYAVSVLSATGTNGFNLHETGSLGTTLTGSSKADNIYGGTGNDTIVGFTAGDNVDGDGGADQLNVGGTATALTAAADSQLANVEVIQATAALTVNLGNQSEDFTINGSTGNDNITGGAGADSVNGAAGNDILIGGSGNDILIGGVGADKLTGGLGLDTFGFTAGDTSLTTVDLIQDYAKGVVGIGDLISYASALSVGGSGAGTTINANGVASFSGASVTLASAELAIANAFTASGDAAGEFAFFKVGSTAPTNTSAEYLYISDGVAGASSNDVIIQLVGVTSVSGIDLTGGLLTITA